MRGEGSSAASTACRSTSDRSVLRRRPRWWQLLDPDWRFQSPAAVAIAPNGDVYVADAQNSRIYPHRSRDRHDRDRRRVRRRRFRW